MIKKKGNIFSFALFILIMVSVPNISLGNKDWIYSRNKQTYCTNKNKDCIFNLTSKNPYSPIIPASFLNNFTDYHSIILSFNVPKSQTLTYFYLVAYDVKYNRTLIKNGYCYLIDVSWIVNYEFQIFNKLPEDSLIQFQFLGLNLNFHMQIFLFFPPDPKAKFYGVALNYIYLMKYETYPIYKYAKQLEEKENKLTKIKAQALEKADLILNKLFRKTIDTSIEYNHNIFTQIIPISPFIIVTISVAVGTETSTESLFEPEDIELSKTNIINGNINFHTDMFDFLGDDFDIDNDIAKIIGLFTKNVEDLTLNLEFETDTYSITIGMNILCKKISYTYRFYDPITNNTFYEIKIDVESIIKMLTEKVLETQKSLATVINKIILYDPKIRQNIYIFVVGVALLSMTFYIIALIKAGGFVAIAAKVFIPLLEMPIIKMIQK